MSEQMMERASELRQLALDRVRAGEIDQALGFYDQALAAAAVSGDDELRELITINKADAMIAVERSGPEVQALPAILMRRRNPHHAFLAAYALMYKHRIAGEAKRASFYGQIALDVAVEEEKAFWRLAALNELGIVYEIDSKFEDAIVCFQQAIDLTHLIGDESERRLSYGAALQNIGASKLLNGDLVEGIELIHKALPSIVAAASIAEAYIDLCYGYSGIEELDKARYYGEAGLELAAEDRQIRNAHYLLGEVAYKQGDIDRSEVHFDELAKFYPDFRHLKSLLYAIDLRSMVNFKL